MGIRLSRRAVAWLAATALLPALLPATAIAGTGPAITGAVSDPTNLSGAVSVAVSGSYAYTTAYHSGELTAIDISNPASPVIAGESAPFLDTNLIGGSNMAIAGGYAFVVSKNRNASTSANDDGNGNSLTILDIHTNPAQPAIVGTVRDTGKLFGTYGVAVSGNYAYVAYQGVLVGQPTGPDTSSGGFSVIDISNPGSPTIVANIDNGSLPSPFTGTNALQHATSVGISGSYAYVTAFYSDRVTVINISSPTAPKIVASLHDTTNLGNPADLAVQGHYVYVADQIGGTVPQFAVLDVSNPAAPKVVGALSSSAALGGAYRIRVLGNFAYIAASGAKAIAAIDVSNPLSPRLAGSVQSSADLNRTTGLDVTPDGRYVVASSPYLSTQFNATYPPYPLQSGGGANTGTISVIQLDPNPIGVTISAASEPTNPTASTSANFTFSATDSISTLRCQLDAGPPGPCTSATTQSYSGLALGSHTFTVQATDTAGNASSSSYTWTVGAAPANTTLPTISGSAVQGQSVTANPGTWSGYPAPTYSYQWEQCDSSGANCTAIQGATSQSYTVQPGDVTNTLSVAVMATNGLGTAMAASGASSQVLAAPANTSAPTLSGTALVGDVLTASTGTWSAYPSPSYAYQWQSCDQNGQNCTPIPGATNSTYTLGSSDAATTLEVVVTATNGVGSGTATSGPSAVVDEVPLSTSAPAISGSVVQGQTLTVGTGTWAAYPSVTYTYQWEQCDPNGQNCQPIVGANAQSYVPQSGDVGQTLAAIVTATNSAGQGAATAGPTGQVASGQTAPSNQTAPGVSGTAIVGHQLTATPGTWAGTTPISYAYQWQRCNQSGGSCANINANATGSTYVLSRADMAFTMRVVVTASNGIGSPASAPSATTAIVAGKPQNVTLPAVSGTATQGNTLTGTSGTWTGYPTPTYTYQWNRCNGATGACTPIAGATSTTYTVTVADVGFTLRIYVVATNTAGAVGARSNPTGSVQAGTLTAGILGTSNARLRVAVKLAPGQPALARVELRAPSAVSFARLQRGRHGIVVRDGKGRKVAFTATLRGGVLTIILRHATTAFTVEIARPELVVTRAAIAGRSRDPQAFRALTVLASNAAAHPVRRTMSIRLR